MQLTETQRQLFLAISVRLANANQELKVEKTQKKSVTEKKKKLPLSV